MEFLKITAMIMFGAVMYGITNDLVTACLCIEFYRIFDLDIQSSSPIVIALTFGVLTTWWVGVLLGLLVACAARLGNATKLAASDLVRPAAVVLAGVAILAGSLGLVGFVLASDAIKHPDVAILFEQIPSEKRRIAYAINDAHLGGYAGGGLGGIALCIWALMSRPNSALSASRRSGGQANRGYDVFLCHNSDDKPQVRQIKQALEHGGVKTWLDEEQLPLGRNWLDELEKQIGDVRCALVFVGSGGLGPWQKAEMHAFLSELLDRDIPVIPVILASADSVTVPVFLKQLTWIDLRTEPEQKIRRLIGEIREIVGAA